MSAHGIAWHYTIGFFLPDIIRSGEIRRSTTDISPRELPVVWFSLHRRFEPTAAEAARRFDDGTMVRARDVRGIRVLGGGLFRFAYPTDRLLRYRDAVKAAHIPSVRRRIMERIAKRVGASPSDWFAAMADVPIKSLPVDYYDGTRWRAISPGTLHSVALEEWQHLSQVLDLIARREFASLPESVRSSIHVT